VTEYMVEYCIGGQAEIRTAYVDVSSPNTRTFAKALGVTHNCREDEIYVRSWYKSEGPVEGGSYGTRWGSTFGN